MRVPRIVVTVSALALLMAGALQVSADAPANASFERTWARLDKPVSDQLIDRTWLWGPEAFTGGIEEEYAGAPGGTRTVQYFDKTRMEDNAYRGSDPWDVTNGLLVVELITGEMQVGDDTFETHQPADARVAGDPSSGDVPTYAALAGLLDDPARDPGETITTMVAADGTVSQAPHLAAHGVTAAHFVEATGHTVAEPFWAFMNSTGSVYEDGQLVSDALFLDAYYATGFPLTEAYWTRAVANGTETDVLVQAFERRVLTYTPTNPAGWQVESGNVGRHYYDWRYGQQGGTETPTEEPTQEPTEEPTTPDTGGGGTNIPVVGPGRPDPDWEGPVKLIDTNVADALICVYDASNVGQDGKPDPIDATEDDCELLLGTGKGDDGSGQGEPDTFFANLGDESTAGIAFTDDTNELSVVVQVEDLVAGATYTAVIAGFSCDLNNDGDCADDGEDASQLNAVCSPDAGAMLPNAYSGDAIVDLGSATTDAEGDFSLAFEGTLNGFTVQELGEFDRNVVVVTDDTGEIVACGIVEEGTAELESPEDAAARLGAIAVAVADANGDMAFGLPPGDYFAVISADGYQLAVESFSLEADETEVNEVNLIED